MSSDIAVGEGFTEPGTVLFPEDSDKTLFILWNGPSRRGPKEIRIRGEKTIWKTNKGITLGTSLKKIEEINGKPFVLAGFGWDYEGTVIHCNGGELKELGTDLDAGIQSRTLILQLNPDYRLRQSPEYGSVLGDRYFQSDHPAMKKLNPKVYEIIVSFTRS